MKACTRIRFLFAERMLDK